jgi:hypothetical protein
VGQPAPVVAGDARPERRSPPRAHDHKCRIAGSTSIGQRSAALLMSDRVLSEAEIDELIAS